MESLPHGLADMSLLLLHPDFSPELGKCIRRDDGANRAIRALRHEFAQDLGEEGSQSRITVIESGKVSIPFDATPQGIVEATYADFEQAGIPITFFHPSMMEIICRDLEFVRGKELLAFEYSFDRWWMTEEGRNSQQSYGSDGNAAAHLVWATETKKMGRSVSIANTDDRLFPRGDCLCAPCFGRDESRRGFYLHGVRGQWYGGYVLVSFREIEPSNPLT